MNGFDLARGANKGALKLWIAITVGPLIVSLVALTVHWVVGPMQSLMLHGQYLAMIVLSFVATVLLAMGGRRNQLKSSVVLLGLSAQIFSNIVLFALFYSRVGLKDTGPFLDLATSLYFSIVTWTTLGYGDLQPSAHYRLIAACQALLGYCYMAMFTAVAIVRLIPAPTESSHSASEDLD